MFFVRQLSLLLSTNCCGRHMLDLITQRFPRGKNHWALLKQNLYCAPPR